MPDAHYVNPKLADIYDLDSPWSVDREFYFSLAGSSPKKILDLGCGTGLLCDAYAANGHDVTGVDPSSAMLEVGRRKPHGSNITWIQSSAQSFESNERFDLIIMTGHAFQVLLNDNDILSTFFVMRSHLNSDGRVVFESRNPLIDWSKNWDYDIVLETVNGPVHESRRLIAQDNDRMTFELRYRFPDEELISLSELRFSSAHEIEKHLTTAGLCIDKFYGDWNDEAFNPKTSREMIFVVRASS